MVIIYLLAIVDQPRLHVNCASVQFWLHKVTLAHSNVGNLGLINFPPNLHLVGEPVTNTIVLKSS